MLVTTRLWGWGAKFKASRVSHATAAGNPSALCSIIILPLLFLILSLSSVLAGPAEAFLASKAPLNVTVLVGPRNDFCYSDHIQAIETLVRQERDRINKAGGIAGRPIQIQVRNDRGDAKQTVENVRLALADPQAIALIGLQNSTSAKQVFESLGAKISDAGIPWISSISATNLISDYPSVFSMQGSQEEENIPVIAEAVKAGNFARPAFIGIKGSAGSDALSKGLAKRQDFPAFVAEHKLELIQSEGRSRQNAKLDPNEIAKAVSDVKANNADLIFLNVGGWRVPAFLKELTKAGVTVPLFVSGRLDDIFRSPEVTYDGDVYQVSRTELPNLYNNRVRNRLFRENADAWTFAAGERNPDAFDRVENACEERSPDRAADPLSRSNVRAIGIGLEFRDMVAMIAEILKSEKAAISSNDIAAIRRKVVDGIPGLFASGRGVFRGSLEDWAFRPSSRTTVRTPFIVARPKGMEKPQLASTQYVPLKGDRFRKIPTFYTEIDLIRVYRIDDTEKSFGADFYLSISDENNPRIEKIDFANAFLDYKTNSRQINIQPLHEGGPSDTYPSNMKIYLVSGKFMLDPNYKNYPFDVQRFTIELRPKSGEFPFIIQPLRSDLRNKTFDSEGWDSKGTYVSYDQDFVSIMDTKKLEPSIVPFYKGNFIWTLKRNATDFYLRVVTPLFFIMIVAYLAIFIADYHFEAIVTIQVTALLSAVALYITTPKVDADTSTLSDSIFLFNYMVFSIMIGISILRVNKFVATKLHLKRTLAILHVAGIPAFVILMGFYVYGASLSESHADLNLWRTLRDGLSNSIGPL